MYAGLSQDKWFSYHVDSVQSMNALDVQVLHFFSGSLVGFYRVVCE